MTRREALLLGEMIDAAEQAHSLVSGQDVDTLAADRQLRDALLWNFTVLGEAAAQLPDVFKKKATDDLPAFVTQLKTVLGTVES